MKRKIRFFICICATTAKPISIAFVHALINSKINPSNLFQYFSMKFDAIVFLLIHLELFLIKYTQLIQLHPCFLFEIIKKNWSWNSALFNLTSGHPQTLKYSAFLVARVALNNSFKKWGMNRCVFIKSYHQIGITSMSNFQLIFSDMYTFLYIIMVNLGLPIFVHR